MIGFKGFSLVGFYIDTKYNFGNKMKFLVSIFKQTILKQCYLTTEIYSMIAYSKDYYSVSAHNNFYSKAKRITSKVVDISLRF